MTDTYAYICGIAALATAASVVWNVYHRTSGQPDTLPVVEITLEVVKHTTKAVSRVPNLTPFLLVTIVCVGALALAFVVISALWAFHRCHVDSIPPEVLDSSVEESTNAKLRAASEQLAHCRQRLDDSNRKRDAATETENRLRARLNESQTHLNGLDDQLKGSKTNLVEVTKRLTDTNKERDVAKAAAIRHEERLNGATIHVGNLERRLLTAQARNVALQAKNSRLQEKGLKSLQDTSRLQRQDMKSQDEIARLKSELQNARTQLDTAKTLVDNGKLEHASDALFLEMKLEQSKAENARLAEERRKLETLHKAEMKELKQKDEEHRSEAVSLKILKKQQVEHGQITQQLRNQLSGARANNDAMAPELSSTKDELSEMQIWASKAQNENQQLREEIVRREAENSKIRPTIKSPELDLQRAKRDGKWGIRNTRGVRKQRQLSKQWPQVASSAFSLTAASALQSTPPPAPTPPSPPPAPAPAPAPAPVPPAPQPPPPSPALKAETPAAPKSTNISDVEQSEAPAPTAEKSEGEIHPQDSDSAAKTENDCSLPEASNFEPEYAPTIIVTAPENCTTLVEPEVEPEVKVEAQRSATPLNETLSSHQERLQSNDAGPQTAQSELEPGYSAQHPLSIQENMMEPLQSNNAGPHSAQNQAELGYSGRNPISIQENMMEIDREDPRLPSWTPGDYQLQVAFQSRNLNLQMPFIQSGIPYNSMASIASHDNSATSQRPFASAAFSTDVAFQGHDAAPSTPATSYNSISNPAVTQAATPTIFPAATPAPPATQASAAEAEPKESPKSELRKPTMDYWRQKCTCESEAKKMFKKDMETYKKKTKAKAAEEGKAIPRSAPPPARTFLPSQLVIIQPTGSSSGRQDNPLPVQSGPSAEPMLVDNKPFPDLPEFDKDDNIIQPTGSSSGRQDNPPPAQPELSAGPMVVDNDPQPEIPYQDGPEGMEDVCIPQENPASGGDAVMDEWEPLNSNEMFSDEERRLSFYTHVGRFRPSPAASTAAVGQIKSQEVEMAGADEDIDGDSSMLGTCKPRKKTPLHPANVPLRQSEPEI